MLKCACLYMYAQKASIGTYHESGRIKNQDNMNTRPIQLTFIARAALMLLLAVFTSAGIQAQSLTLVYNESELRDAVNNDVNIIMSDNITLSKTLIIDKEVTVTINLNGFTLSRGLSASADGDGHVMIVGNGANVSIYDGTISGGTSTTGTITGGYSDAGGAIWIGPRGTVTLMSGTITGCHATIKGGAICNNGTMNVTGGTISGNTGQDCGGIYNSDTGTLTISGGTISGNTSGQGGGGVVNYGSCTISGGSITGNIATTRGGGVWSSNILTVSGGTIKENTAGVEGGGIYLKSGGTLYMSGNPVVKDNTMNSLPQNLYLNGVKITCNGAFTNGAEIYLTPKLVDGALTTNYSTYNGSTDPNTYLKLDGSIGFISLNANLSPAEAYFSSPFDYITDVMLIGAGKSINDLKTTYRKQGWTLVDKDLNAGAGGAYVFLLYKTKSSPGSSGLPITDFYVKISGSSGHPETITSNGRTYWLTSGGGNNDFNNGGRDLNRSAGGNYIHLYYTKEAVSPARALTGITIDGNSVGAVVANGGTSAADLNSGAGGDYIYMHALYSATSNPIYVTTEEELRYAVTLNDAYIIMQNDINLSKEIVLENNTGVTLDLNGHTLDRGLSSAASYGHVLKIMSGSALTINDASGDNSGIIKGGYTGSGGALNNFGTLTINGGTIKENHTNGNGAGILNNADATLYVNGGRIEQNHAKSKGGGIYNEGTLYMSGNPVVKDNQGGESYDRDNVHLPIGKTINVSGAFTEGADIHVLPETDGNITTGYGTHHGTIAPSGFFTIDVNATMRLEGGEAYCTFLTEYITDLMLIGGGKDEINNLKKQWKAENWRVIDKDLNEGRGGDYIFLLYKTTNSPGSSGEPISNFYITHYKDNPKHPENIQIDDINYILTPRGGNESFNNSGGDLNHGAGKKYIYIYYTKDQFPGEHRYVTNIVFEDDVQKIEWDFALRYWGERDGSNVVEINAGIRYLYMVVYTEDYTKPNEIIINNTDDWNTFCNNLLDPAWNNFSGKTVKLAADISAPRMAGTSEHAFGGTFDGQGHIITAFISDTQNEGTALFSYIKGATIKNLNVAGTINGALHAGAIVGFAQGTNSLWNCKATATVSGGTHIGGLVANAKNSNTTIDNCLFSGQLTGGETAKGAFVGWGDDGGTKTVSNSLYIVPDGQDATNLNLAMWDEGAITLTNCYKTGDVGSQGQRVYLTAPVQEVSRVFTICGTTVYAPVTVSGLQSEYYYTGYAIEPNYTLTDDNGNVLTPGTDYTVAITSNGNPVEEVKELGIYTLILTGTGNYTGTKRFSFQVNINDTAIPTELVTNDISGTTATATWTGTQENYNVRWRTADNDNPAGPWQTAEGVNSASLELTGLTPGTKYEWQVQGILPEGSSTTDWSESVFFTTRDELLLAENADNSSVIAASESKTIDVTLQGRTLWKDGSWNTLCLPFSLTNDLVGTPLEGAIINTLDNAYFEDGTLTLTFSAVSGIEAGKPYIVKWTKPEGYVAYDGTNEETCSDIVNPVFSGVTITSTEPTDIMCNDVIFHGIYSPYSTGGKDNTMLYLGANNKLYYPNGDMTIGAFRAYFQLSNIISGDQGNGINNFVLNFGDETNAIVNIQSSIFNSHSEGWYTLDGRRLQGKPSRAGIYINNGIKVVIK